MDGAIERSIATTIRLLQKLQEERGHRKGVADGVQYPVIGVRQFALGPEHIEEIFARER
jgi:hypothetical protein